MGWSSGGSGASRGRGARVVGLGERAGADDRVVSDRPVTDVAEELAGALEVVVPEGTTVALGNRGGLAAHQDKSTIGPSK